MALRGTTVFIPLLGAVYFKEKISPKGVLISIIVSPIATILFETFKTVHIDSLYIGLFCSFIIIFISSKIDKDKEFVNHILQK